MSTITKEEVISVLKGELSPIKIIIEYCREFNKEDADIRKLIIYLQLNVSAFSHCYKISLDYFIRKYEIVLVHDNFGNLISAYQSKNKSLKNYERTHK